MGNAVFVVLCIIAWILSGILSAIIVLKEDRSIGYEYAPGEKDNNIIICIIMGIPFLLVLLTILLHKHFKKEDEL